MLQLKKNFQKKDHAIESTNWSPKILFINGKKLFAFFLLKFWFETCIVKTWSDRQCNISPLNSAVIVQILPAVFPALL